MIGQPWTTKPPVGTPINQSHPLAPYWGFACNENGGKRLHNLNGVDSAALEAVAAWTKGGVGNTAHGSGSLLSRTFEPGANWSCTFIVTLYANTGNSQYIICSSTAVSGSLIHIDSGNRVVCYSSVTSGTLSLGRTYIVTITRKSLAVNIYINGNFNISGNITPGTSSFDRILDGTSDRWLNGRLDALFFHNRILTFPEAQALATNPWQFYEPQRMFLTADAVTLPSTGLTLPTTIATPAFIPLTMAGIRAGAIALPVTTAAPAFVPLNLSIPSIGVAEIPTFSAAPSFNPLFMSAVFVGTTLMEAQDFASRHPLVEIISTNTTPDIPFDGTLFTGSAAHEFQPFIMNHSSGNSILIYCTTDGLILAYTDMSGTHFTIVPLPDEPSTWGGSCSEMPDGNVGILYFTGTSSFTLKYRIVTPAGGPVSNGSISTWSGDTSHTWVIRDDINSRYVAYYSKLISGSYRIYQRTSPDFIAWSAESALSISGLTAANPIGSPSIMQLLDGNWWLFFDYVDYISPEGIQIRNIYRSISTNQGSTWGAAVALTSNSSISQSYQHPVAIQKSATDLFLAYTKYQTCLAMRHLIDGALSYGVGLDYNPVTGMIYQLGTRAAGVGSSSTINEIDIDSWSVTRTWNLSSTPSISAAIPTLASMSTSKWGQGGSTYHVVWLDGAISVLNSDSNVITSYYIKNDAVYGTTANITADWMVSNTKYKIMASAVDEASNRLYLWLYASATNLYTHIGYIDLTDTGPTYILNTVLKERSYTTGSVIDQFATKPTGWYVSDGMIFFGFNYYSAYAGCLFIMDIATGALIKTYRATAGGGDYGVFPFNGANSAIYYDGTSIWMAFDYTNLYGQADLRGLLQIDLATDNMTYHRPDLVDYDDYKFNAIRPGKGDSLIITSEYGIFTFNKTDFSWTLINKINTPQLPSNMTAFATYDPIRDFIFVACDTTGNPYTVALPWGGMLKSSQYAAGVYSGGSAVWAEQGPLVQGLSDYDAVITQIPSNSSVMLCFWENLVRSTGKLSLMWDTAAPGYDLTPHVISGTEVSITRDVLNTPNRLEFTCAQGHLFDPHNSTSLLAGILKKGRRLTVKWGERIGEINRWQNAGVFYVSSVQLAYQRGVYTDVKVAADDVRSLWHDHHIYSTDYYSGYPETVLSAILQEFTNLTASNIAIPELDTRVVLEHQWVDTTPREIIQQFCDRFGYYATMSADDQFTLRKISNANPIDHIYTDSSKLISFAPDDSYSNYTNRITVTGQSRDFVTETYPEERVGQLNGTVGWYGFHNEFKVFYSQDQTKLCVDPRLVVIESALGIGFKLAALSGLAPFRGFDTGSIEESISFVDPNHTYCTVKIESPDLIEPLVEATITAVVGAVIPDSVITFGVGATGGYTIRIGTMLNTLGMLGISTVLGSIGNYQFEIWAKPIGRVRRSVQATADDLPFQSDIGQVVEKTIEEPLCYSVPECQVVADHELLVCQLQRKRVKITKIAHLQDDEGDTIRIPHPYTDTPLTQFATNFKRRYMKPENPDGEGHFLDDIEGWVL